jgi:hypothetical protein
MNFCKKLHFSTWIIIAFFVLDIVFVALHFLYGQQNNFFNLDMERNLPTLYQSFQLITIASLSAAILTIMYAVENCSRFERLLFIPYWLVFVYLGLDDIGQIHENFADILTRFIGNEVRIYTHYFTVFGFTMYSNWLLFFIPIMLGAVIYLIFLATYLHKERVAHLPIFLFAVLCFVLVPVIEYLDGSRTIHLYAHNNFGELNILIALEEYIEMLGATLFLTFNILLLRDKVEKLRQSTKLYENA